MGHAIADNYLKHGYEVRVWNRTQDKANDLVERGAQFCSTPTDAANSADIVIEVTADNESSREVWLGQNGILQSETLNPSVNLITCATLSVDWVYELQEACKNLSIENSFFDMPMTGGRMGAEAGSLTLLVGGDKRRLNELMPSLEPIAAEIKYFGEVGSGTKYKLILNTLQAIHIAGFGEALQIAQQAGLDLQLVGDALAQRPGGAMTNLMWENYKKPPEPINFSVQWIAKDLSYASQLASELDLPLLADVSEKYHEAIDRGHSQSDWSELVVNQQGRE